MVNYQGKLAVIVTAAHTPSLLPLNRPRTTVTPGQTRLVMVGGTHQWSEPNLSQVLLTLLGHIA